MKKSLRIAVLLLVACALMPGLAGRAEPVRAQAERRVVYLVTYADETYTLLALDPIDGRQETLFSVPESARGGLPDLLPAEELDALNRYFIDYNASTRHPIASIADLRVRAWVHGIAVSPDNREVVAKVEYQTCFIPQNPVCFGTTQLILIDRDTHEQRILLSVGAHDDQYQPSIYPNPEMQLGQVQWMPQQRTVIVALSNRSIRRDIGDSSIVAVPIDGTAPFKIGEGKTWAAAPSASEIVILSKYNHQGTGFTNTLYVVVVDVQRGQYSDASHVLKNYLIDDRIGLAFLDRFVVFERALDTSLEGGGGGLAVFDTQTREGSMVLPDQFFREIQASPDVTHLVLETRDHLLVEAHYEGGVMHLSPLTAAPVTDWQLGSAGDLLVQYTEGEPYHWLDAEGVPVTSSVEIKAPSGSELRSIDW